MDGGTDFSGYAPSRDPMEVISQVLLVDDSRAQRRIIRASLAKLGFEVTEASSGSEALELCRTRSFDLVLSDWMMPGLSGPEFCGAFRELGQEEYTYFILITSKSDKVDVAKGLDIGADDFLTKPVSADELRSRIRAGARVLAMQRQLSDSNRMIQNTLERLQTLYGAIDKDLKQARDLQQSLVPERSRRMGTSDISLLLEPCGHIGGDLVGSFDVDQRYLGLFAIDVSGHGVASALLTVRLAGHLTASQPERNLALDPDGVGRNAMLAPHLVCERFNALMLEEMDTELYFTMALARVDTWTGEIELAQAGHPNPMIQRGDGRIEAVGDGGMPIGLIPEARWASKKLQLDPGDRLLIYSDGITECPGAEGGFLEEDGLTELLRQGAALRGARLFDAICKGLATSAGETEMPDDISAVLYEFYGRAPGES